MIEIAKQTIDFYLKNFRTPNLDEINIENKSLLETNGSLFVTIYKSGEVRGSAGNIKEIKNTLAEEIIENTISAISKDSRFKPIKLNEVKDLKIRIDLIKSRNILQDKEILQIDPTKQGVLAIKKDYSKMAAILPNINPSLLTGEDLLPILESKFNVSNFKEEEYILYKIETETKDNFDIK